MLQLCQKLPADTLLRDLILDLKFYIIRELSAEKSSGMTYPVVASCIGILITFKVLNVGIKAKSIVTLAWHTLFYHHIGLLSPSTKLRL